jgi:ATP-dependent DNA helicase RecG
MLCIFISSVQKELAAERRALKDYIHGDPLLRRFFEVFLFEDLPASDRLEVWNPGTLSPSLTLQQLREPHGSFPANPLLAEPLYLAKYIERMGTGTRDMIRLCRDAGLREPDYAVRDGFVQTLWRPPQPESTGTTPQVTPQVKRPDSKHLEQLAVALAVSTPQVTPQVATQVTQLLQAAETPLSREDLQRHVGLADRKHFREVLLNPLLAAGWLEMTIPETPQSRLQQYRLTEKGRAWLAARKPEGKK